MAPRYLTVLIGAGASFDAADQGPGVIEDLKPPLANQLFQSRGRFNEILVRYPGARNVADELRSAVGRGEPIETAIRKGLNSPSVRIRKQYVEVPLYIQELLGEVSRLFVQELPTRYHTLVNAVEGHLGNKYEQVLYLTLNYDTLLEKALCDCYRHQFRKFADFCSPDQRWALVKLHGSSNWGFPLMAAAQHLNHRAPEAQRYDLLEALLEYDEEPKPRPQDLVILNSYTERVKNSSFMYPAIAAPVEGKTDFVGPIEHSQYAEQFIVQTTDLLVLGCAIQDLDVLNLFSKAQNVSRLKIVNGAAAAGSSSLKNLRGCNGIFQHLDDDSSILNSGFSGVTQTAQLAKFLAS